MSNNWTFPFAYLLLLTNLTATETAAGTQSGPGATAATSLGSIQMTGTTFSHLDAPYLLTSYELWDIVKIHNSYHFTKVFSTKEHEDHDH